MYWRPRCRGRRVFLPVPGHDQAQSYTRQDHTDLEVFGPSQPRWGSEMELNTCKRIVKANEIFALNPKKALTVSAQIRISEKMGKKKLTFRENINFIVIINSTQIYFGIDATLI